MTGKRASSLVRAWRNWLALLPVVTGMLMLTSLVLSIYPEPGHLPLFGHGRLADVLTGAAVGAVASGHPSAGYVLGAQLRESGVPLDAVTALLVSWVTVGIVQLPVEMLLGRRFALLRNLLAFLAALAIGLLLPLTPGMSG